jgi:hypothetical protein
MDQRVPWLMPLEIDADCRIFIAFLLSAIATAD